MGMFFSYETLQYKHNLKTVRNNKNSPLGHPGKTPIVSSPNKDMRRRIENEA